VICDATGVGDPVLELLRKSAPSRPIEGLVFTNQTKSELIDGLAWMFEQASLKMEPNPDLLRELEHFEAEVTGAGNVRLAASGSGHDDLVTALALASRLLPRSYRPRITLGPTRTFSSPEPKEENRC
jgi:phage FluMu gp28-like protein